jgi:hypothetical protein
MTPPRSEGFVRMPDAMHTAARMITTGVMLALRARFAIKL